MAPISLSKHGVSGIRPNIDKGVSACGLAIREHGKVSSHIVDVEAKCMVHVLEAWHIRELGCIAVLHAGVFAKI